MKDNRKAPFVSNKTGEVRTASGRRKYPVVSYARFNEFETDKKTIKDHAVVDGAPTEKRYEIVQGTSDSTGNFTSSTADMASFDIYGETVYTDVEVMDGVGLRMEMAQKGFRLPLDGSIEVGEAGLTPSGLVKANISDTIVQWTGAGNPGVINITGNPAVTLTAGQLLKITRPAPNFEFITFRVTEDFNGASDTQIKVEGVGNNAGSITTANITSIEKGQFVFGARNRKFLIRRNSTDLDPARLPVFDSSLFGNTILTYVLKLNIANLNSQSIFQIAQPSSTSSFSIAMSGLTTLTITNHVASGTPATQAYTVTPATAGGTGWITLVVQAIRSASHGVGLGQGYMFNAVTGELIASAAPSQGSVGATNVSLDAEKTHAYIGVGEGTGGVNPDFTLDDFLVGVDIAEITVYRRGFDLLSITELVQSHLASNAYKSGFNNRSPKRTHQLLDARSTYPASSTPGKPLTTSKPFDDTDSPVFGQAPPGRFIEFDPLKSFGYDAAMQNTGVTARPETWIATGGSATNITRETVPVQIVGLDAQQLDVIQLKSSNFKLSTRKGVLPVGKYNFSFKVAGTPNTAEAADNLRLRKLNLKTGTATTIENIRLNSTLPLVGSSAISKYEKTFALNIEDEHCLLQFVRFSGAAGEFYYLWDFEFSLVTPKAELVYPEMIPASLYSGSKDVYGHSTNRGAPGDTQKFFRDIHNTPFDKRLTAPGFVRPGLSHTETEILNESVRNSPVTISQDTNVLGGVISPFNDANPQISLVNERAVSADTNADFDQRLGDHVAIVIELDPSESTTIGVERHASGDYAGQATGRITSMAYYNFSTRKWETAGKNNDFIIPGAITIQTSSAALVDNDTKKMTYEAMVNSIELFNSASVGFAGTSGFTIYPNLGADATSDLKNRALPTSNYGFPVHKKYEAKDNQHIKMSDYISSPFVLERVGFEFGAAIEDSGPHSLGYKLPFITSNNPDRERLYPQIFYKTSNNLCSLDNATGDANVIYDRASIKRGEFINGSPVVNLGDFGTSGFDKGNNTTIGGSTTFGPAGFTSASATHVNQLLTRRLNAGGDPLVNTSTDTNIGYFRVHGKEKSFYDGLLAGVNVGVGISPQIQFLNHVAVPRTRLGKDGSSQPQAPFTFGKSGGLDYHLMTLTASMFLKASAGPRNLRGNATHRNMRNQESQLLRPITAIPVLAGGVNGVVTGSWYRKSNLNFSDPALGIFTNDADDGRFGILSTACCTLSSENT